MSLLRFFGLWLALDAFLLGVWCLCIIAQTARQARENRESDDAERSVTLDRVVIVFPKHNEGI